MLIFSTLVTDVVTREVLGASTEDNPCAPSPPLCFPCPRSPLQLQGLAELSQPQGAAAQFIQVPFQAATEGWLIINCVFF